MSDEVTSVLNPILLAEKVTKNLLSPALIISYSSKEFEIVFQNQTFIQFCVKLGLSDRDVYRKYIVNNSSNSSTPGNFPKSQGKNHEAETIIDVAGVQMSLQIVRISNEESGPVYLYLLNPVLPESVPSKAEVEISSPLNQKLFKALVHDGMDMIAVIDENATYKYVGPTSTNVLGIAPEDFIGKSAFDFIHPEDYNNVHAEFVLSANKKKVTLSPYRFLDSDGSWRYLQTTITDLRHVPDINGFVANSQDITSITAAVKQIEESQERYRYATMATAELIWDLNLQTGGIVSGTASKTFAGYELDGEELRVEPWLRRIHPKDKKKFFHKMNSIFKSTAKKWTADFRLQNLQGDYIDVQMKAYLIRDANRIPLRIVGALSDTTKRNIERKRLHIMESVATNTIDAVLVAEIVNNGEHLTKITFVNEAFERLTGYSLQDVTGRSPLFLQGSGSDKNELYRLINNLKNNRPYVGTIINYTKDGSEIWVNYSVTPLSNEVGKFTHWVAILRDVSEQKILEKNEALLKDIARIFNDVKSFKESLRKVLERVAVFHSYGFVSFLTATASGHQLEVQANYFSDDTIRDYFDKYISEGDLIRYASKALSRGGLISDELFLPIKKWPGDIQNVIAFPVYNKGATIGALVFGVTKADKPSIVALREVLSGFLGSEVYRKKIEQDLEQIFTLAPDIIAITDYDGNFKTLNPAASRILGYSQEDLISKPFTEYLYQDTREATIKELFLLRESGRPYNIEERYITREGRSRWISWTSQSLKDERLIYSVGKDITQQKELEELLSNANSLAKIGSWEIDYVREEVTWSVITREILGVDIKFEPSINNPLGQLYQKKAQKLMVKRIDDCRKDGTSWDELLQYITYKGEIKWLRCLGRAEFVNQRCIRLYGSIQDVDAEVSAKKTAQSATLALEESEKRYSELFHFSPTPIWVYDYNTLRFLDVNQTAINHYGYSKKDFLSMSVRDLRAPSELQKFEQTVIKTRTEKPKFFQGVFEHLKKDGTIIHVDIKSSTITYRGKVAKIVVATDITERIEYYKALADRNEILKEIAWVQSHKVRAPLARLMALSQLLINKQTGRMSAQTIVEGIVSSANELDVIIREIVARTEAT